MVGTVSVEACEHDVVIGCGGTVDVSALQCEWHRYRERDARRD